ncbi:MAG: mechanosensitive ion channel [Opitutaceae bacterium]|nr:mechanosensitive ion channel [Opitutaceae bacterium]
MNIDWNYWTNRGIEFVTDYGLRIAFAIAIFVIGRWVAGLIQRTIRGLMERNKIDPVLTTFASSMAYFGLLAMVALASLNKLGIETTSFVALIGAAGLAVGLAVQGSLSNFAAGVLIIIFRPFRLGDYIEGGGTAGVVKEITILTTVLATPDNKKIIVPNSAIMSGNITNYSANDTRRLDLTFGVSYGDDLSKVKRILEEMVAADPRCLKDPAPTVGVLALADSSINFAVRPWVKTSDYWGVHFDMQMKVKQRFDAEGITIPFPQRDVHLYPVPTTGEAAKGAA